MPALLIDEEEFQEARPSRRIVRRVAPFVAPYRKMYAIGVGLEVMFVVAGLFMPHLLRTGIHLYIVPGIVTGIVLVGLGYLGLLAMRWAVAMIQVRYLRTVGQRVMNDLRRAVFRHVQDLSLSFFDRTKEGRIIARADRDVDVLEPAIALMPAHVLNCVVNLGGALALLALYSWRMALSLLLVAPPLAVATLIFRRKGILAYRRIRRSTARITSSLAENISGVQEVQASAREPLNLERFREVNEDHHRNVLSAARVWNMYWPSVAILFGIARMMVLGYGGYLAVTSDVLGPPTLAVGTLVAANMLLGRFFQPLMGLSQIYNELLASSAAAERIFSFLDTKPEVADGPAAVPAATIEGNVRFNGVWFAYNSPPPVPSEADAAQSEGDADGNQWVLRDVNLKARAGDTMALVGRTGSGKSTVMNLIARFYDPQRGAVLVDGRDARQYTVESLHRQMGIVLQENFLFSGTVMENLKFGRPSASDGEAIEAAEALGADPLFRRLSRGYESQVHERGAALSIGERQLICFTRALVANPRILILDEATSAVDAYTETILQEALERLMRGRTTFVVAHRLSTIRNATRVYVIDAGRVVEEGTHDDLVNAGGTYQRMYEQFVRE